MTSFARQYSNLFQFRVQLEGFSPFFGIRGKIRSKTTIILLTIAILMNLFVTFKLHPDIISVKQQIKTFETQADESSMRHQFRKLHGVSALLNILLLIDGIALLILNKTVKREKL